MQTFDKINKTILQLKGKSFRKKEIDALAIEIRNILLEADISYDYIINLVESMKKKLLPMVGRSLSKKAVISSFLKSYINNTFSTAINNGICLKKNDITTISVYGSNGVGKTFFVAKLANFLQKKYKKKVLCVSFDLKRRSSCTKLKTLCKSNNIDYVDIIDLGIEKGIQKVYEVIKHKIVDVLIVDNVSVICNDCRDNDAWKAIMNNIKFDEKIVVIDGTCGQNVASLIQYCDYNIRPTGFAISKVDCDQKGGIFFSVASISFKPIYYILYGEKINNISEFNKKAFSKLLKKDGLKNITDLFKKSNFDKKKHILPFFKKYRTKLSEFDYNGLLKQLVWLKKNNKKHSKLMSLFLKFITISNIKINTDIYVFIEKWISIILSMTKFERLNVGCLNDKRIKRIANGAGVSVDDVIMLQKKMKEINEKLVYY